MRDGASADLQLMLEDAIEVTRGGSEQVPALIFGAHIAALGVLRVLSTRGIPCYVVDETSNIITGSRWYRPAERKLAETYDSGVLAEYLQSLRLPRAVLIPCSDNWSLAVSGLPAAMRERFLTSIPPHETVQTFVDKDRFRALVERLDIPRPRSIPLRGPEDLEHFTDDQLRNAFFKPTEPQLHQAHFGTKGSFVESRQAAERLMRVASAAGISFLVQEWIAGNMAATVLVEGFVDHNGRIVGMVARRRLRVAPPMIGNTVSSVTIPLSEVEGALPGLRRLLAETRYRGGFNVEFKFDVRDGAFKILELNARPAWYVATIASAGLDIPWSIYLDAQGLPVESPAVYRAGRYGLYEFRDAVALMRYVKALRLPEGAVLGPWIWGDHTVFWWSDPMPALKGMWQILERRLGPALGRPQRPGSEGNGVI